MAESDWKNVQRNKTTGQYRTTDGGSGGASNFADLEDVDFDDLQDGQVPKYDAQNHKWINADESGGGGNVDDVEVNGVSVLDPTDKIAKIISYKEVTMSEYQALPDSKLTDNVMYCIKDIGGANQFPPLIYSDEEREVGVWRDGKPLYQKTYNNISITNGVDTIVDSSFANKSLIKYEIDFRGIPNQDAKLSFDTSDTLYINSNSQLIYYISRSGGWWNLLSSADITVWYTKTTDTPGSGTWTTQGGYAHHYSTSEKVVGTWIDGKPIYEKSWEFDSYIIISTNGITSLASKGVVLSGVDYFVNAILISKVDKRVCNTFTVGYFSGDIGVYNATNADEAIDKVILQYTKTTD